MPKGPFSFDPDKFWCDKKTCRHNYNRLGGRGLCSYNYSKYVKCQKTNEYYEPRKE